MSLSGDALSHGILPGAAIAYLLAGPNPLALTLGATFVARSFSGDKTQLIPILKAGLRHNGFALIDIISPCVSFNDHEGSTKSYKFTREHEVEIAAADFVPLRKEISAKSGKAGDVTSVTMHDGSIVRFRKTAADYDPTDRNAAYSHVKACRDRGEIATGLLYMEEGSLGEMHALNKTVQKPLVDLTQAELCPGSKALDELMGEFR